MCEHAIYITVTILITARTFAQREQATKPIMVYDSEAICQTLEMLSKLPTSELAFSLYNRNNLCCATAIFYHKYYRTFIL